MKDKYYTVYVPVAGVIGISVEAKTEAEAIELAFKEDSDLNDCAEDVTNLQMFRNVKDIVRIKPRVEED